jgi:hypothetical protein
MKTRIKMIEADHMNNGQEKKINDEICQLEASPNIEIVSVKTHFLPGCGYSAIITYTINTAPAKRFER